MSEELCNQEYARLLQQSFLFMQTPEEAVEELLAGGWRSLPFRKGKIIFGHGENQDCLGLMVSGRATARSGDGVMLRNFERGDVFGAAALFAEATETFSVILAESNGEALLLPLEAVRHLIKSQPQAAENYVRFLAQRIAFLNHKIATLSSGGVTRRLAVHIISNNRSDSLGRPICPANISRLTQSLGISRASIYRALDQLADSGCLHREGKIIVIDNAERLSTYK
jgi:CRP-like cAMP-binding protein